MTPPTPTARLRRRPSLQFLYFWGILAVAAALRLYKLGQIPAGIFRDEAEKGLNGWFLLQNGTDATGHPWPLFIEVFGVTTSAIYQYATIPFLAIGGLTEFTTRLPAAVVGTATVALTWAFARRAWNWKVAAWAAAFLAVSPWHMPLSRWAQQGIFLPFFFAAAAYTMARFITAPQPRTRWLAVTGFCLGLAMYSYDPARLFAPLLPAAAAIIWFPVWKKNRRAVLAAFAFFLVTVSPVLWLFTTQTDAAAARFRFLSIAQPGHSSGQIILQFLQNYAAHFSPGFLLATGDANLRHGLGRGVLTTPEIMGTVTAVFVLVFSKKLRLSRRGRSFALFCLLWILLAPIPASLTREGIPHALRTQMALPAWQLLAAYVLVEAARSNKQRLNRVLFTAGIIGLTAIGAYLTISTYFRTYPRDSALEWQYGVKQALQYVNQPATQDSQVVFRYIPGAEYIVPFYEKMSRAQYRQMMAGRSRFQFDFPLENGNLTAPENWLTRPPAVPTAIVAPPQAPIVQGSYPFFITVQDDPAFTPALQVMLSPQLFEQVQEHASP